MYHPKINRAAILIFSAMCVALFSACGTKPGDGEIPHSEFSERHLPAIDMVKEIDVLRRGLADTIVEEEVDEEVFKAVCKPVGMRAKALSEESGWEIKQMAIKYRNPNHKADEQATAIMERFASTPELESVWERVFDVGNTGWRYFAPIRIEPACMACHGPENARPQFILDEYPSDLAYDFEVGDLRGVYSVFVPDSTGL